MSLLLALLLCASAPLQDPKDGPHRQLPTERYPVPDFVTDPELRKLLGDGLAGDLRNLFPTAEERERFLKWAQRAAQKPASQEELLRSFLEDRKGGGFAKTPSLSQEGHSKLLTLMKRMADHTNARDSAHGGGLTGKARLSSGDWFNRHAPTASEFLERYWDRKAAFNLQKGVDAGLRRFQSLLEKWDTGGGNLDPRLGRSGGDKPSPSSQNPSPSATPSRQLPSLPGGDLPGAAGAGSPAIVLALVGAGLLIAAFYFLRRRKQPPAAAGPAVWRRPALPASFGSAEEAAETYRALTRFALQAPLTGLSHLEIESAVVRRHPAAADAARALTSGFESLYYEPGSPAPLSLSDATRFLEATSAHAPRA